MQNVQFFLILSIECHVFYKPSSYCILIYFSNLILKNNYYFIEIPYLHGTINATIKKRKTLQIRGWQNIFQNSEQNVQLWILVFSSFCRCFNFSISICCKTSCIAKACRTDTQDQCSVRCWTIPDKICSHPVRK